METKTLEEIRERVKGFRCQKDAVQRRYGQMLQAVEDIEFLLAALKQAVEPLEKALEEACRDFVRAPSEDYHPNLTQWLRTRSVSTVGEERED